MSMATNTLNKDTISEQQPKQKMANKSNSNTELKYKSLTGPTGSAQIKPKQGAVQS